MKMAPLWPLMHLGSTSRRYDGDGRLAGKRLTRAGPSYRKCSTSGPRALSDVFDDVTNDVIDDGNPTQWHYRTLEPSAELQRLMLLMLVVVTATSCSSLACINRATLFQYAMAFCLSVCLSVCLFARLSHLCINQTFCLPF